MQSQMVRQRMYRREQDFKRIAHHCIERTDGLFITLPEDSLEYQQQFITACQAAGIDATAIDPKGLFVNFC